MPSSILNDTKKVLGLDPGNTAFDTDVIMHVNTAFGDLHQLGVGPAAGYAIEDDVPVWTDFTDSAIPIMSMLKSYIYLRVRLLFDTPATSFAIDALKEQRIELEWRILAMAEEFNPPSDPSAGTYWWDLTGTGGVFPDLAAAGDIGWDSVTGDVWMLTHDLIPVTSGDADFDEGFPEVNF